MDAEKVRSTSLNVFNNMECEHLIQRLDGSGAVIETWPLLASACVPGNCDGHFPCFLWLYKPYNQH